MKILQVIHKERSKNKRVKTRKWISYPPKKGLFSRFKGENLSKWKISTKLLKSYPQKSKKECGQPHICPHFSG
jgi:hypothetical protein